MEYKIKKYDNETMCFVDFTEGENKADFKGYLLKDENIEIESFLSGSIGKHKFERAFYENDTFLIKGVGRGRKPENAIKEMKDFIKKCLEIGLI